VRGGRDETPGTVAARAVALTALVALAVAMGIGRFAFTPLLPMMQDDAGLSTRGGALLASANYFGYLAGALAALWVRRPPRHAACASLLVIGACTCAMAFFHQFAAWALLRFLAGAASAWVLVFVSDWALAGLAARQRPDLGGVVFAGVGAGIAFAGLACLALMAADAGSRAAWLTLGIASLAASAGACGRFTSSGASPRATPPAGAAAPRGEHWRLVACYGALGFGYIIPATFLPAMAKASIADPRLFGWAWPVFGAAATASTLGVAALAKATAPRKVWRLAVIVMAFGVALPVFAAGLASIIASALCVGGTFMVISMAGLQEARRVAGANAKRHIAAMTASFAVGQIAGPLIVGALAGAQGFSTGLLIACGVLLASATALGPTPQGS
jgi:predicted MFS family arabinose efflux permease